MIDIASLLHGTLTEPEDVIRPRLVRLVIAVYALALGCGAVALFYIRFGIWCFFAPPVLTALAPGILTLGAE